MKKLNQKYKRIFVTILFLYSLFILWEMFLGPYRLKSNEIHYNIYPFKTIFDFIINFSISNLKNFIINIIANILLFVPFGFLTKILFEKLNFKSITITYIFIIIILEIFQVTLRVGVFDIDDILLNVLGVILGYLIYNIIGLKFIFKKEIL
ncbi:MAG: VanZ family protein [Candidatus Sericytochromatia bacterium]